MQNAAHRRKSGAPRSSLGVRGPLVIAQRPSRAALRGRGGFLRSHRATGRLGFRTIGCSSLRAIRRLAALAVFAAYALAIFTAGTFAVFAARTLAVFAALVGAFGCACGVGCGNAACSSANGCEFGGARNLRVRLGLRVVLTSCEQTCSDHKRGQERETDCG